MEKLKYFSMFLRNTQTSNKKRQKMTTTTITELGITRMNDDAEYEAIFSSDSSSSIEAAGTPRPKTYDNANNEDAAYAAARATFMWSFSQAAKQHAADTKRRRTPNSRTIYRMGANARVKKAFELLKKKLDDTRELHDLTPHLSEEDFKLLKQGIENFRVKIIVDDSVTLDELRQMREANGIEMTKTNIAIQTSFAQYGNHDNASYIEAKDKYGDQMDWNSALTAEINRVQQTKPAGVPSQHARISPNDSGRTLRNILAASTIRRKFISLNNLTMRIRQELVVFLSDDARANDRVEVVKQIKEACIAARKSSNQK
jgi:hypothetical protein